MRERQREGLALARKVLVDLVFSLDQHRVGARHNRIFGSRAQTNDFTLQPAPVHPVKNVQTIVIGESENGAQWRVDPG